MSQASDDGPRHIFITGHARSGSSILLEILNSSPEVFVLDEAELYWFRETIGFAEYFNGRATFLAKGTFIPSCVPPEARGDEILAGLGKYFRLTGDKVALGPDRPEQVHLFHYLTGQHLDAFHVFTVRRPDAALVSMHRMFPEIGADALIGLWLDAVSLMACCLSVIPKSYVVPLERLSEEILHRLAALIGIEPVIAAQSLQTQAASSAAELSWLDEGQSETLARYVALYDDLLSFYCPMTLRFHNPSNAYGLFWDLIPKLKRMARGHAPLIDRVWQPLTAATDFRRAAIAAALNKRPISGSEVKLTAEYVHDYPNDGFGHYALGFALLQQGVDVPAAIREFSAALHQGGPQFWARYNRAHAYEKMGETAKALADFEEAVRLDPDHQAARQRLAQLRTLKESDVASR
jgi:tetratricopeptide (TPR) repeat protein